MRSWGILTLLALSAIAVGCHRNYDPVHNPSRIARFEQRLLPVAARDSGCSPPQVSTERIAETVWVANTCTGPREYWLHCRRRGSRWSTCSWRRITPVNEAAAIAFHCPPSTIAQQPTAVPTTRLVQGCGMSAQSSLQCTTAGCGWMLDGPAQGSASQAQPSRALGAPESNGANQVIVVPAPSN